MSQQVALRRLDLLQQVTNDFDGLDRKRHDVGRNVLRPLSTLAHAVLQLFDHFRRDDPQATFQVELIRGR
ncbi:hypothetical protein D3C80_1986700 [compost metagenome]